MFFLLYKRTDDGVFDEFSERISDHFPKIFENFPILSGGQTNVPEYFSRISENFLRYLKIFEEGLKMFR